MKVSKAIETLEKRLKAAHYLHDPDYWASVELGFEALKWVKRYRPDNKTDRWAPLPGETPEEEVTNDST